MNQRTCTQTQRDFCTTSSIDDGSVVRSCDHLVHCQSQIAICQQLLVCPVMGTLVRCEEVMSEEDAKERELCTDDLVIEGTLTAPDCLEAMLPRLEANLHETTSIRDGHANHACNGLQHCLRRTLALDHVPDDAIQVGKGRLGGFTLNLQ